MTTSPPLATVSCLTALPSETLARLGLEDLNNPIVTIEFRLEEGRINVLRASTVHPDDVRTWFEQLNGEQRQYLESRRIHLRVDEGANRIIDGCEPYEEKIMLAAVDSLFEQMQRRRGLLTEMVAHLPTFEDLHSRIEVVARTRLQRVIDSGQVRTLPVAIWTIALCCQEHHAELSPDQLTDMAQNAESHHPVNIEPLCQALGGQLAFVVPAVSPTPCVGKTELHIAIIHYLGMVAHTLLDEIVPRLYAEHELELRPSEGVLVVGF